MKPLVLVYNFPHQIMAIRASNLFGDDARIVNRAGSNLKDTLRFCAAVLKERPKLLYVMDIGLPSYVAALLAKTLTLGKVKVFVDTGDLVYLFSRAERKYGSLALAVVKVVEDGLINLADRMVVRAPYHQVYLRENYRKKDIMYLPDGVDLDRFKPLDAKALRKELGLDGYFVMGVMGNLFWIDEWEWCYGWYELAALSKLKDLKIRFLVVGDGRGLERLKARAKELGIEDQVVFTGRKPHAEVNRYLNAMDAFIFTQPHHLQTRIRTCAKLPELLAAGSYVVSTDLEEPMRFLGKNATIVRFKGLKDPSYPGRLAAALRKLYKNRSILADGKKGRALAKASFSYPVLRRQLKEILERPFT